MPTSELAFDRSMIASGTLRRMRRTTVAFFAGAVFGRGWFRCPPRHRVSPGPFVYAPPGLDLEDKPSEERLPKVGGPVTPSTKRRLDGPRA